LHVRLVFSFLWARTRPLIICNTRPPATSRRNWPDGTAVETVKSFRNDAADRDIRHVVQVGSE